MARARGAIGRIACAAWLVGGASVLLASGSIEQVLPYRIGDSVLVELEAHDLLDERTSSTIDSGLPGTCVYLIQLEDGDEKVVFERLLELSLRLDLWENRYWLDTPAGRADYLSIAEADSAWSHLQDVEVCVAQSLDPEKSYRVRVEIAVQPLAPTDRARLSKYISGSTSQNNDEVALDVGAFLGRLLAGSSGGEDHVSFTGPFFRIGDLEKRE